MAPLYMMMLGTWDSPKLTQHNTEHLCIRVDKSKYTKESVTAEPKWYNDIILRQQLNLTHSLLLQPLKITSHILAFIPGNLRPNTFCVSLYSATWHHLCRDHLPQQLQGHRPILSCTAGANCNTKTWQSNDGVATVEIWTPNLTLDRETITQHGLWVNGVYPTSLSCLKVSFPIQHRNQPSWSTDIYIFYIKYLISLGITVIFGISSSKANSSEGRPARRQADMALVKLPKPWIPDVVLTLAAGQVTML